MCWQPGNIGAAFSATYSHTTQCTLKTRFFGLLYNRPKVFIDETPINFLRQEDRALLRSNPSTWRPRWADSSLVGGGRHGPVIPYFLAFAASANLGNAINLSSELSVMFDESKTSNLTMHEAPGFPFQVHNIETSVRSGLKDTYQAHLVGSDLLAWHASGELYWIVDEALGTKYMPKWDRCRTTAWFARHSESGEVKVIASACRLRWCSLCSNARRAYVTHEVAFWIKKARYPKFLTLTLKHSDAPLAHQIDSLYLYFRKFRKAKFFRDRVPGGIWFFQIKRTKNTGQWHPHLHCCVEGDYIAHGKLSKLWESITHGSKIIDVSLIHNSDKASFEVARYASAPADLTTNKSSDYLEIFQSLHGRKSCGTWGTAKKVSLRQPLADDKNSWESVGSWSVVQAFQGKESAADDIVKAWSAGSALPLGVTMKQTEESGYRDAVNKVIDSHPKYLFNFFHPP